MEYQARGVQLQELQTLWSQPLSWLVLFHWAMAAIPPGSRQRCTLCQVEIQGMVGGQDLAHFSQGAPGSRAKLWARVCQYLRSDDQKAQCLNQDARLRGSVQQSDYYAEAPVIELPGSLPGSEGTR